MFGFKQYKARDFLKEWEIFENKFEIVIPNDYKKIANFFGPGEFDDFLVVFAMVDGPGEEIQNSWIREFTEVRDLLKKMSDDNQKDGSNISPYTIGKENGELFLLMETSNGNYVFFEVGNFENIVLWDGELPDEGWQKISTGINGFMRDFIISPENIKFMPSDARQNGHHFFKPVGGEALHQQEKLV